MSEHVHRLTPAYPVLGRHVLPLPAQAVGGDHAEHVRDAQRHKQYRGRRGGQSLEVL